MRLLLGIILIVGDFDNPPTARAVGTEKTARHETLAKAYSRPEVEGTAANYHGPLTLHQAAGVEVA